MQVGARARVGRMRGWLGQPHDQLRSPREAASEPAGRGHTCGSRGGPHLPRRTTPLPPLSPALRGKTQRLRSENPGPGPCADRSNFSAQVFFLSWSAWAAITTHHRLFGLNKRNLFSPLSGGWKFEISLPAWSGSGVGSLPGLYMAAFLLFSHVAERENPSSGLSSSNHGGSTLMTSCNPTYLPASKYHHTGG